MTATDLVLAELIKSGRSPYLQAFFLTVFWGEVGNTKPDGSPVTDPWRTEYGYGLYTGPLDTFPSWADWPGLPLENGLVSTALGPLQITHTTWDEWSKLPSSTTDFNPPGQITCGLVGAVSRYQARTGGRDLDADLQVGLMGNVQAVLTGTWPGGMRNFVSQYPKALAAIQNPPTPTPIPPAAGSLALSVTDGTNKWGGTIPRIGAAVLMAMIGLGSGGVATAVIMAPKAPTQVASAPIAESEVVPYRPEQVSAGNDNATPPVTASVQPSPSGGSPFCSKDLRYLSENPPSCVSTDSGR